MPSVIDGFVSPYPNDLADLHFFSDSDFPHSFSPGAGAGQPPVNKQMQSLSLLQSLALSGGGEREERQNPASFDQSGEREPHLFEGQMANARMMQRSFSSRTFDGHRKELLHRQPRFGRVSAEEQRIPAGFAAKSGVRRVCSAGDLEKIDTSAEESSVEEAHSKVGRYSAEARKERIHRYRAKRNQRNFNKTIKYACRKTLADNRPRIRGRFARNDDALETPKPACSNPYEAEDDFFWIEGLHGEIEYETRGGGNFFNGFGAAQF